MMGSRERDGEKVFIIFEGMPKTGVYSLARELSYNEDPLISINKYKEIKGGLKAPELGLTQTGVGLDWLTHLAYRLSIRETQWGRKLDTEVFSSPNSHLVISFLNHESIPLLEGKLFTCGELTALNSTYKEIAQMLINLNYTSGPILFKSISLLEVSYGHKAAPPVHHLLEVSCLPAQGEDLNVKMRKLINPLELLHILHFVDGQI